MKDRKFKHIETKEVFSAFEDGLRAYRALHEELIQTGQVPNNTPFEMPPREDLIVQGVASFEYDDDYMEIFD